MQQVISGIISRKGIRDIRIKPGSRAEQESEIVRWCCRSQGNMSWIAQYAESLHQSHLDRWDESHPLLDMMQGAQDYLSDPRRLGVFVKPLSHFPMLYPEACSMHQPHNSYRLLLIDEVIRDCGTRPLGDEAWTSPSEKPDWWDDVRHAWKILIQSS